MNDFLRFETMITPVVIQVLFWIAVVAVVIMGFITMGNGGWSVPLGLIIVLIGPIFVRVYAELVIVMFRINGHLREIEHNTSRG